MLKSLSQFFKHGGKRVLAILLAVVSVIGMFPIMAMASNGDTGGLNPGSSGGQKPTTNNVAWSTVPDMTFLRFTLVEFPKGVVTDLNTNDSGTWKVVGTPLNIVWNKASSKYSADDFRSKVTWYDSSAMLFNGAGSNAAQLMGSTVKAYSAASGNNSRRVMTADEFRAATGITAQQEEQMFHCNSSSWTSGWLNGDYTSMWGTDPHPVTPGNLYNVYTANNAFVYLLTRLSETDGEGTGWSKEDALAHWSEFVHDSNSNLRTKYRVIIETGGIFTDPDRIMRAYTLREMMAYSLYNNEASVKNTLIWDQSSTIRNMAQWMRQSKDKQFVEYPLDDDGIPTGDELHSTNGFREADSFVDSIKLAGQIRSKIFSERRSFGLHILNPFNFERVTADRVSLEVTKTVGGNVPADQSWDFTLTYTAGTPTDFTATKNGADCKDAVTSTDSGLKFSLKGGETIHFDFDAEDSFRCEVKEDDASLLTNVTGSGGTADLASGKFTTSGGFSRAVFTNSKDDTPPPPAETILYKRDAKTNAGVGPATFKFSSVTNGDYEFDTDENGELEAIQWWDPTEEAGKYIKPGEYTVTELIPPPSYTRTDEVKQIKLELDADGDPVPAGPLVFTNLAKPGLRIVKYDRQSHSPMEGVTFDLYKDGAFVGRYETNADGEILLHNIDPGTYRAVEVDTGDEIHIVDGSYQEVELVAGDGIKDLIFFNDVKPGLKLTKVDSSDPSKVIPNAVFEIKAVKGDYGPEEFTTGSDGTIDLSKLPEGSYVVTEKSCPGYVIDEAQRIIHLKANDTAEFVFTNSREPSLRLVKTGADGKPLADVTFRIAPIEDGTHSLDRTTDEHGEILIDGLEPGVYSVVETATRQDYILDETEHHVVLRPGKTAELRLTNDARPTLVITKVDINGKFLPGAIFEVKTKAGVKIDDFTIGPDGKVTIPNTQLDEGYYIITEIQAPSGYILDSTPHEVYLRPNQTTTVTIENEKKPGLTIKKVDSIVGDGVKGAKFEIWVAKDQDKDGTYTKLPSVYYTDTNGLIELEDLDTGWYRIVEVEPPAGFMLKDPSEQTVYVEHDKAVTVTFENIPKSALVIRKIDSDTGAPLAGAWFRVRYLGGISGSGGTIIGEYQTSTNGNIVLTGLDAGTYVVEEISAPRGYVMDTAPQTAYISGKEQDCITLTFTNSKYGSVLIKKVDSVTGEPLSDVQFYITNSDGAVLGNSNGYFVTDSAGTILISDIMPGTTLVVKETRTRPGYILDETPQTIKITSNETKTLEFRNQPTGSLLIRKVCSVNPSVTLQNAEFKITYADGTVIGDSNGVYRSDENGEVRIDGLTPGKSVIVTETKAPAGFIIDTQSQTVEIKAGKTVTLTMKNQPKGELIVQKRDSATGQPLPGAEFRITTAAGCEVGLDGVIGSSTLTQNGIFTTDANGEIRISNLAPGAYVITEIKAPDGYVMDSPSTNVVIGAGGDTQTVVITNTPKQTLTIQKYVDGTTDPIKGVTFLVTSSSGEVVGPNNGIYITDENGRIVIPDLVPGTTITAKETKTVDGYVLDTTPKSILIKEGEAQALTFYNKPVGGLELIKVSEVDKTQRIKGVTFEIRRMDGGLVDTVTTDSNGRVFLSLEAGNYYAVEIETAKGFMLDDTPHYFTIKDGKTTKLTVTNAPLSGVIIHKVDSVSNSGIYGVKFLVYDANKNPVGEYTTDQGGYIYIDDLTVLGNGKLYIRELEAAPGYELDKEYKTVYVQPGKTIEIEWHNTPITGQIQVYKYAAEANEVTGTPAGAPLQGAVYEISEARSGKVVDYITTDARGIAASKPLPLGRYKITEVTAPAYWQLSGKVFDETLEYSGQIIKVSDYDKPAKLGVSITKRGNAEGQSGSQMRYVITVANTSNVPLESFYWHDRIPTDSVRATVITTGTYSARLNYRVLYKTNYSSGYQVLASNLLTSTNYSFNLAAIPMQAGEFVTDIYLDFGKVPVGFQSATSPTLTVQILGTVANGYQIVNRADVGGKYQGTWQTAQASWVTIVRKVTPTPTLPKTGY